MNRLKVTLILVLLMGFLSLIIILFLSAIGVFKEINITVSNLRICTQNDPLGTNADAYCGKIFPQDRKILYICGIVDSNELIPDKTVDLSINLHIDNEKKAIYTNPVGDLFGGGNFCRKFEICLLHLLLN